MKFNISLTETFISVVGIFARRENLQCSLMSVGGAVCNGNESIVFRDASKSGKQRYVVDVITGEFFFVKRTDIAVYRRI